MNISLIRESFQALKPHSAEVTEHFYADLGQISPQVAAKAIAQRNEKQDRANLNMLSHVIEFFDDQAHIKDYLVKIGRRYSGRIAGPDILVPAAKALLSTFSFYFDAQWTEELELSWTELFEMTINEIAKGTQAATRKVIEMKKEEPAKPSLSELAHAIAQELLKKAIDEELASPAYQKAAREKAQELLNKVIEAEAIQMLSEARSLSRTG